MKGWNLPTSEILREDTHIYIGNIMLEGDADYGRPCRFPTWNTVKGVKIYIKFSYIQSNGRGVFGNVRYIRRLRIR